MQETQSGVAFLHDVNDTDAVPLGSSVWPNDSVTATSEHANKVLTRPSVKRIGQRSLLPSLALSLSVVIAVFFLMLRCFHAMGDVSGIRFDPSGLILARNEGQHSKSSDCAFTNLRDDASGGRPVRLEDSSVSPEGSSVDQLRLEEHRNYASRSIWEQGGKIMRIMGVFAMNHTPDPTPVQIPDSDVNDNPFDRAMQVELLRLNLHQNAHNFSDSQGAGAMASVEGRHFRVSQFPAASDQEAGSTFPYLTAPSTLPAEADDANFKYLTVPSSPSLARKARTVSGSQSGASSLPLEKPPRPGPNDPESLWKESDLTQKEVQEEILRRYGKVQKAVEEAAAKVKGSLPWDEGEEHESKGRFPYSDSDVFD